MELWLPPSVMDRKPKHRCLLCGAGFTDPSAQARHVAKHYRHEEAEVRMLSMRERAPHIMGDGGVDTEFEQWHRVRGSGKKD
jgi:hypothetical protein